MCVLLQEKSEAKNAHDMLSLALKVEPTKIEAMCTMGVILETRAQQMFREKGETYPLHC